MDKPGIVKVCTCTQCKAVKAKRKNRKTKKFLKRQASKFRRNPQNDGKVLNIYWA